MLEIDAAALFFPIAEPGGLGATGSTDLPRARFDGGGGGSCRGGGGKNGLR
jgi:hypothetical protein